MRNVHIRALARRDLADHYVYLSEHAGSAVADRFLTSAQTSFRDLADRPAIATVLQTRASDLAGMRKWRVKGFESFLIFYLTRQDGVSIVRVLHAAQDWWRLLDIES
jgi:toxin ParE1/3/4